MVIKIKHNKSASIILQKWIYAYNICSIFSNAFQMLHNLLFFKFFVCPFITVLTLYLTATNSWTTILPEIITLRIIVYFPGTFFNSALTVYIRTPPEHTKKHIRIVRSYVPMNNPCTLVWFKQIFIY